VLSETSTSTPVATTSTQPQQQYQQVLAAAQKWFAQDLDWVSFFREVMGIDGVVRRTFPNFDDLATFERSPEFDQIQKMVVRLREKKNATDTESEPTRVITVRLPKSMHEYLRTEAHDLRTSMNKLCISKLLQVIEQDMIPTEKTAPPKRRTTPVPSTPPTTSYASVGVSPHSNGVLPFKTNY
jgi:predicted HicB family RNase H-like nuclease